jgi:hypothetical protein
MRSTLNMQTWLWLIVEIGLSGCYASGAFIDDLPGMDARAVAACFRVTSEAV